MCIRDSFRSAAALGVDAVLVSPACYDPLYRRAVRVSMGTVFQVPWTRIGDADVPNRPGCGIWSDEGIAELHEHGFTCAAMALSDDSMTPDELNARLTAVSYTHLDVYKRQHHGNSPPR